MAQSTKCLILLAVIALFFVTEIIPLAVTAMAGSIACGLLGFIPAKQVFSGLSNSTVVLFAGMFVVGAAMFYTGLAQKIGETVVKLTGTGESDDGFTDFLCQAGVEHCSAYNEHAGEQNNGGVGQAAKYLFCRDESQEAAGDSAAHSCNCQRDNFGNEE